MAENMLESGVYAPGYYKKFKCIADQCRHSCCIGWEICIDGQTCEKYSEIEGIRNTVENSEDGPCFRLEEGGRCPHLNSDRLCDIIIAYGEGFLSEICKNHPRFYNFVRENRVEAGLGIVCEEACRLVLENEFPFELQKIEELEKNCENCEDLEEFNPVPQRNRIISLIEAAESSFYEKLEVLCEEFEISNTHTPDEWLDIFLSLEMLDGDWEQILKSVRGRLFCKNEELSCKYGKYYQRLLLYFVYRHVSIAENADSLRARLGFAMLSAEVIRSLFECNLKEEPDLNPAGVPEALIDLARRYSAEIEYSEENTDGLIFEFQ